MILFLCLWPDGFHVESKGTLEPVERRDVFAGIDGVVQELLVKHGDTVKAGQLLVKLRSTGNRFEPRRGGRKTGRRQECDSTPSNRQISNDRQLSRAEEKNRKIGEASELEANIISLKTQRDLLKLKQAELMVKSPDRRHRGDLALEGSADLPAPASRAGADADRRSRTRSGSWNCTCPNNAWASWKRRRRSFTPRSGRSCANCFWSRSAPTPRTLRETAAPTNRRAGQDCRRLHSRRERPAHSGCRIGRILRANEPAESPPAAEPADDPLAAEVDAELAKIPDEQLHDRWSQLAKAKLDAQLKEILKDLPEGEAKNQLGAGASPADLRAGVGKSVRFEAELDRTKI